ncbi:MAG: homocysteine S-methyltransferase family protein [Pseudomonadota bacterium]
MAKYRHSLPQLGGQLFVTDGGIETTLIFLDGIELPHFASFPLFGTPQGVEALYRYFHTYGALARRFNTGLILETATWRASPDWGGRLGYTAQRLQEVDRQAVRMLEEIRTAHESDQTPIVISGCLGPRGDGYVPDSAMSAAHAAEYHRPQIETFAETAADLVTVLTMNYVEEAEGIAQAAKSADMPVVVSFTVETDGKLPTGQPLGDAIQQIDDSTGAFPAYYMINCAHPSHFDHAIRGDEPWTERIRGVRANASRMSHAELNDALQLDAGNPIEFGRDYVNLRSEKLTHLNVLGGCCGTDHRHIEQLVLACESLFPKVI